MSKTYLVDSSAIIAYLNEEPQTKKINLQFHTASKLVIPFTVLEEVSAVLFHRYSKELAKKSAEYFVKSNKVTIYCFDHAETTSFITYWNSLPSQLDFVDASLIWIQEKTNLPILTLDRHFGQVGATLA